MFVSAGVDRCMGVLHACREERSAALRKARRHERSKEKKMRSLLTKELKKTVHITPCFVFDHLGRAFGPTEADMPCTQWLFSLCHHL